MANGRGGRITGRRGPRQPGDRGDQDGPVAQRRRDLDGEPADRALAAAPARRRREAGAPNEGLVALQTAELLRTTLLSRSDLPRRPRPRRTARRPPARLRSQRSRRRRRRRPECRQRAARCSARRRRSRCRPGYSQPRGRQAVRPRAGLQRAVASRHDQRPGRLRERRGGWPARRVHALRAPGKRAVRALPRRGGAVIRLERDRDRQRTRCSPTPGSTTAGAIYVRADGGVAATRWLRLGARAVAGAVP